jgi:hypothetical protein
MTACATPDHTFPERAGRMRTVAEDSRPTLGQTGQIFVTYAAARAFIEPGGYQEHEVETARRALTELLIDARQQTDPQSWRTRKRSTKLDISAIVQQEGRLLVVTYITAQAYDPQSRTSAGRRGGRSRLPAGTEGTPGPVSPAPRGASSRRGRRRPSRAT